MQQVGHEFSRPENGRDAAYRREQRGANGQRIETVARPKQAQDEHRVEHGFEKAEPPEKTNVLQTAEQGNE